MSLKFIDNVVINLFAILFNEDYYLVLFSGKVVVRDLSVLRPEYLILFNVEDFLNSSARKESGEYVGFRNTKKYKNDILRIFI